MLQLKSPDGSNYSHIVLAGATIQVVNGSCSFNCPNLLAGGTNTIRMNQANRVVPDSKLARTKIARDLATLVTRFRALSD